MSSMSPTYHLPAAQLQAIADEIFAPWVRALDFRVAAADADGVTLSMAFAPAASHTAHMVCGQALLAVADSAMVLALAYAFGAFRPVATVDMHMQFMRAAKGDLLVRAQARRIAKTVAFASVAFFDAADPDQEIARASGTFTLPPVTIIERKTP